MLEVRKTDGDNEILSGTESSYRWDRGGEHSHHAYLWPTVKCLLPPTPPLRILDAGCGNGFVTAQLAAMNHQVIGIDASRSASNWPVAHVLKFALSSHRSTITWPTSHRGRVGPRHKLGSHRAFVFPEALPCKRQELFDAGWDAASVHAVSRLCEEPRFERDQQLGSPPYRRLGMRAHKVLLSADAA